MKLLLLAHSHTPWLSSCQLSISLYSILSVSWFLLTKPFWAFVVQFPGSEVDAVVAVSKGFVAKTISKDKDCGTAVEQAALLLIQWASFSSRE